MFTFYKGILATDLKDQYIPGTVTTSISEALLWKERISSNKKKGVHRNLTKGQSVLIRIKYADEILDHSEFQKEGLPEHSRKNCWTSSAKTKAQINTIVNYKQLNLDEVENLLHLEKINKHKYLGIKS